MAHLWRPGAVMGAVFVVCEGGEGSGKSTLAAALARRLEGEGRKVVLTREPGGTKAGEQVRTLLHEPLTPWAEAFAFLLARAQLVAEVIRPALERGEVVVCDRFEASTFAYQGYGRRLDLGALRAANRAATGGLEPTLTLYVDIDPALGLARKRGEAEAIRTGAEDLAFHERVREGYRALAKAAPPGTSVTLDGSRPPAEVEEAAWAAVSRLLGQGTR
jgi:dTMP kinase